MGFSRLILSEENEVFAVNVVFKICEETAFCQVISWGWL